MANKFNYKPMSLCCKCDTPSPICPWKYNFTPVDGWDAEPQHVNVSGTDSRKVNSYIVKTCPLYTENVRTEEDSIFYKNNRGRLKNVKN